MGCLRKYNTIKLFKGATTSVLFDFSHFNFADNTKCVFTLSPLDSDDKLLEVEFTESKKYIYVFKDEFTATLDLGNYRYNIMYIIDEERYPLCLDSEIKVDKVVNRYNE